MIKGGGEMADIIGKNASIINGSSSSSSKETTIPRICLFTKEGSKYFLYDNSFSGVEFSPSLIPDPILCCTENSELAFRSWSSFNVHVDWDDGDEEDIEATKTTSNGYIVSWRALDVEYKKNPSSPNGGWRVGGTLPGGGYLIPRPNHQFKDSKSVHKITFTFSNDKIDMVNSIYNEFSEFPIIELYNLTSFTFSSAKCSSPINWKRLQGIVNLKSLNIRSVVNYRFTAFPDELFQMKNLEDLRMEDFGVFNTDAAIEASGIRNFSALTKLRILYLYGNAICKYIKEFNSLQNLTIFYFGSSIGDPVKTPKFNEISEITLPKLSFFSFMQRYGDGNNSDPEDTRKWGEEIDGKLRNNIGRITIVGLWENFSLNISTLPEYLINSKIGSYDFTKCMKSVARVNKFIDLIYDATIKSTMNSSNPMYGKRYNLYISAQPWNKRPSGTNQAPIGFVKGSSNGTPASQMEKVYVMVNNYGCSFTLAPEDSTNSLVRTLSSLPQEYLDYCIIPEFSAYNTFPTKLWLFHNKEYNEYWISQTIDDVLYPENIVEVEEFNGIDDLKEYLIKNNIPDDIYSNWEMERENQLQSAIAMAENNREKVREVANKLKKL